MSEIAALRVELAAKVDRLYHDEGFGARDSSEDRERLLHLFICLHLFAERTCGTQRTQRMRDPGASTSICVANQQHIGSSDANPKKRKSKAAARRGSGSLCLHLPAKRGT
jgi:hypothetical protein